MRQSPLGFVGANEGRVFDATLSPILGRRQFESDGDDDQNQHQEADDDNRRRDRDVRLAAHERVVDRPRLSRNNAQLDVVERRDCRFRTLQVKTDSPSKITHLVVVERSQYRLTVVACLLNVVSDDLIEDRLVCRMPLLGGDRRRYAKSAEKRDHRYPGSSHGHLRVRRPVHRPVEKRLVRSELVALCIGQMAKELHLSSRRAGVRRAR